MEDDFSWEETTVDEKEQEQWNVLFEQIVKGNVIPVIGSECVHVGGKSSLVSSGSNSSATSPMVNTNAKLSRAESKTSVRWITEHTPPQKKYWTPFILIDGVE